MRLTVVSGTYRKYVDPTVVSASTCIFWLLDSTAAVLYPVTQMLLPLVDDGTVPRVYHPHPDVTHFELCATPGNFPVDALGSSRAAPQSFPTPPFRNQ